MAQQMGMKKKTTTTFIKITIIHTPIPMTPFGIRIYSFSWIASSICAQCMRCYGDYVVPCNAFSCVCLCLYLRFCFDLILCYCMGGIGSDLSALCSVDVCEWWVYAICIDIQIWAVDAILNIHHFDYIQMRLHTSTLKMFWGNFFKLTSIFWICCS